jgi:hypothetical protein
MAVNGYGQNLVLNPSFEDTVSCPTNGFITNCQGWEAYSSSPDYYNSCVPSWSLYSVPNNYFGEQMAASGKAYAGIFCYVEGEIDYSVDREILGNSLITSLTISQKYYVSFKVALTLNTQNTGSSLAINKLGALFSTVPYTNSNSSTIPPIENFAQVYTDSIITDSTNWTSIFGSFTADSAYNYISIGNFFKVQNTDTVHIINNNPFTPNAYYYIDDICVSTDSSFCANYTFTGVEENNVLNSMSIYPNPASDIINIEFNDNEIHNVKLYNSTGQIVLNKTIIRYDILNVGHLPQGMYFMQTNIDENITIKKLIIY